MTQRSSAHFESEEPFLEKILAQTRWKKITPHIPQGANILDLGCGYNAKFLQSIEEKISSGIGLDLSVSPEKKHSKIKLIAHNLNESLPLEDNMFDIVISLANFEHLEDPEKMLREIHRMLKPGGKLLLTTPTTAAKPVLEVLAFLRLVSKQEIRDHKHYFNRKRLRDLAKKNGFTNVLHDYFELGMNNFLMAKK